ncbi:MAG: helix-turn-helix transcriptional regulator [Desulfosarcina sp.]|nr:helix-turn-helix transcriptional regulator [Desulfobacterales bacterium]
MIPESQIGKNIKALRLARKLTLEAMAAKAGLTKGYLSKVENSKKSPPVSTLIVIAKALGVTLSQIFGEENTTVRCSVVKKAERQFMAKTGVGFGYSYETLAHKYPDKKMEPSILTIPADSKKSLVFQHDGEEMVLVIEGTMRFFHGEDEYLLEPGDCVYYDSSVPHYALPADNRDVKCVDVIYVP